MPLASSARRNAGRFRPSRPSTRTSSWAWRLNPRAAAIAELVLWIGHLQWHFRTRGTAPFRADPARLREHNIYKRDAVLCWDGYPMPQVADGGRRSRPTRIRAGPNGRSRFIVGNPPFIGGKDLRARSVMPMRRRCGPRTADERKRRSRHVLVGPRGGTADAARNKLRRFGFVTTNSITQEFSRRVMKKRMEAKTPVSLVMAIPDHPWTKVTRDSAAVRIAMTVAEAGKQEGLLLEVTAEEGVETDSPVILFAEKEGKINSDLTVGVDVTAAQELIANQGVCSPGMKLHGSGFIVSPQEAEHLGLGKRAGLEKHIRVYRNGRDLMDRPRGVMVIDLFGLQAADVRVQFPEVYQHVLATVKSERDQNNRATYRDNWWIFGEPRRDLRPALVNLPRYIATVETAKHRVFQFLDASILPDNMLIAIGIAEGFPLGILSSRFHVPWALRAGGWLGVGNDPRYSKSRCFDPFPFPAATDEQKQAIGAIAEELDAHRKCVLEQHQHLTLTGLYNVLERLKAGARPDDLDAKECRIFDDGLVLIIRELHERLDAAVADAYGWPADLPEEQVLANLVALNRERAKEEKRGEVKWLRPDYQIKRFGSEKEKAKQLEADFGTVAQPAEKTGPKPAFPPDDIAQTGLVMNALISSGGTLDAGTIAASFKQGRKVMPAISSVLVSLYRMGLISTTDGGKTFTYRRAA
jgi:hypothetical protein